MIGRYTTGPGSPLAPTSHAAKGRSRADWEPLLSRSGGHSGRGTARRVRPRAAALSGRSGKGLEGAWFGVGRMTRFVLAGLLVAAVFSALAVPHVGAAWCQTDLGHIEEAGVGFDCRFPNGLPACMGHTPGFDAPVPYVRCDGTEVPPGMAELCSFRVGATLVDDSASCKTEGYVPGTRCEASADSADPLGASASCC